MFDRSVDAYMDGHFQVVIESKQLENGNWEARFTSPHGQTVAVEDTSVNEAHRRCSDLVREGVLKREIQLFS